MAIYCAKVVVDYYFEIDTDDWGLEDDPRTIEDWAYYNFHRFEYSSEVYSVDVEKEFESDEEEEEVE